MRSLLLCCCVLGWAVCAVAQTQPSAEQWRLVAAQSSVKFKIKNAGFGVDGSFKEINAFAQWVKDTPLACNLTATAKAQSIDTGIGARDNHLRKAEYFDVATHPEITFVCKQWVRGGPGWLATGTLTLKGVSKQITLPVRVSTELGLLQMRTSFGINRRHYGVGGSSWLMADELQVEAVLVFEPNQ